MVTTTLFWFFHEWKDDQGRYWAAPHYFNTPSEAREQHMAASAFYWVKKGMVEPYLSALFARDRQGAVELQQPCAPGDDPTRPANPVQSPAGAGQVSSVVKAEVQRRDPGSIPGGSTELPF
jgi:hypothetical protein